VSGGGKGVYVGGEGYMEEDRGISGGEKGLEVESRRPVLLTSRKSAPVSTLFIDRRSRRGG